MTGFSAGQAEPIGNPLEALARFTVESKPESLPDRAISEPARAVVDYAVVAIAGAADPPLLPLVRYLEETFRTGEATVLGTGSCLTPEAAEYVTSAAGHVLEIDDNREVLGCHPTVVVLPAALALAEALGRSAKETLVANVIGVEGDIALGGCLNYVRPEASRFAISRSTGLESQIWLHWSPT